MRMLRLIVPALVVVVSALVAPMRLPIASAAASPPSVYGIDSQQVSWSQGVWSLAAPIGLYSVDPSPSGTDTKLGTIHLADGTKVYVSSIAEAPDGTLYAASDTTGGNQPGFLPDELYRVSTSAPCCVATPLGSDLTILEADQGITGITFSPHGRLFALLDQLVEGDYLVQLDATNGHRQSTFAQLLRGYHFSRGLAFRPDNTLVTATQCLDDVGVSCDPSTNPWEDGIATFTSGQNYGTPNGYGGQAGEQGTLGYSSVAGMFYVGSQLYGVAAYQVPNSTEFNTCSSGENYLISIDESSNTGTEVRCTVVVNTTTKPQPLASRVAILINGIGTQFTADDIKKLKTITQGDGCNGLNYDPSSLYLIRFALHLDENFPCANTLDFSYKGGTVKNGLWVPNTYSCSDTGQSIYASAVQLISMMEMYQRAHPGVQYILVGHSLGGVVALETERLIAETGLHNSLVVTRVVTFDSPLNHTSKANLDNLRKQFLLYFIAQHSPCYFPVLDQGNALPLLLNSTVAGWVGSNTSSNKQSVLQGNQKLVTEAQGQGAQFMTTGNSSDCVWDMNLCHLDGTWDSDTGTMTISTAANHALFDLGTNKCNVSGAFSNPTKLSCLQDGHGLALTSPDPVNAAVSFIGSE